MERAALALTGIATGLILALPLLPIARLPAPIRHLIWLYVAPNLSLLGAILLALWLGLRYRPPTADTETSEEPGS